MTKNLLITLDYSHDLNVEDIRLDGFNLNHPRHWDLELRNLCSYGCEIKQEKVQFVKT